MRILAVKFAYLPLLLLLVAMWCDRCESLTDNAVPRIFFPFGGDEGDNVLTRGYANCQYVVYTPYYIFNYRTLYVRFNNNNVRLLQLQSERYNRTNICHVGQH